MDWAEKYRPQHLPELLGNREAIRRMVSWAQEWRPGTKPLLIYGKPGIGKTSAAYALAQDMHWDTVELNASDQRTKAAIEKISSSAHTHSLSGARRLILLDEADSLSGSADRGGARAVVEMIRASQQPMILIVNDLYGVDSAIKAICEPLLFRALQSRSLVPLLRSISAQEKRKISDDVLVEIAERATGDIRSAVNMLYAASIGIESTITAQTSGKDKRSTIFDLVSATFEAGDPRSLLQISFEMDETPDVALLWLEENLSLVTNPNAQSACYHMLTRADQFLGRTLKTQYYTLWRYATACMLFGVNAGAHGHVRRAKLNPPSRLKKIGTAKRKRLIRQSLYHTIGSALHMAQTTVRADYIRPVSVLSQQNPEKCAAILTDDVDQLSILLEDPTQAKAIAKALEKERKEAEKAQKNLKTPAFASPSKKQTSEKKSASAESESTSETKSETTSEVTPETPSKSNLETFSNTQPVDQPQERSHGEESKDKENKENKEHKEEKDAKDNAQATLFSFG